MVTLEEAKYQIVCFSILKILYPLIVNETGTFCGI